MVSDQLITEFIKALDEEIKAIKTGRGTSVVKIFNGRFLRENSGIFIYSFRLENFIATIDDAPVELQIGNSRHRGEVIQTQGLEVILGVEHDLGLSVPEAKLITNLSFLLELLKQKLEAVISGELSENFDLADLVFKEKAFDSTFSKTPPSLEDVKKMLSRDKTVEYPNKSQLEAIRASLSSLLTLVWGPPGTGKTKVLARIVECYVKSGMRVLVVAHANAAVDKAAKEIAKVLKTTEYCSQGCIIRIGNCQREVLGETYDLVALEEAVEKLGESLRKQKSLLEQYKIQMEQELSQLTLVLETIQEREVLSYQIKQLSDAYTLGKEETGKLITQITQLEDEREELDVKLHKAKSSGFLKRFFLGLNPAKIQERIKQITVRLDDLQCRLREKRLKLQEVQREKSLMEERLCSLQQDIDFLLDDLEIAEQETDLRKQELDVKLRTISDHIRKIEEKLDELRKRVLSEAKVICTTLTKTFSEKEFPEVPFDVLVVDEASMAPMPYLYWALGRCRKAAVIVGDFLQLPPICVSDKFIVQEWLGKSIYQHLEIDTVQKAKEAKRKGWIHLLDTQYRMNPAISAISNEIFYDGLLKNGKGTHERRICEGLSERPLTIIDTSSASPWCSRLRSGSRFNVYSALLVAEMSKKILESELLGDNKKFNIGIITPYAAQARLISKIVKEDMRIGERVKIATVHRFQGGEEDIIIFDTVEGPGVKVAPMLAETRKESDTARLLNVAMTRARCKIFLIANLEYLEKSGDGLPKGALLRKIIERFRNYGEVKKCEDIVKPYFVRDFERWIEEFLDAFRNDLIEVPSGSLHTERSFYPAFFEDLRKAEEEVIILSPFISVRRSAQFAEFFRVLINRGVKVRIFTQPIKRQTGKLAIDAAKVVEQMQKIGVDVIERERVHQKVAIIDRKIAWEGSLNILSHRDTHEQMRRLPYVKAVNELIRFCELDDLSVGNFHGRKEQIRTFERCPKCGEDMIIRIGRYGPFLFCPNPNCPEKHNINRWNRIKTHVLCPECGQPMVLRWGPKGPFLGCSNYPKCRKTMKL